MTFHRRAVSCDLCGQQFFPSSLPFHMKSCVIKQQYVEVPCPHCDEPFRQCDLQHHIHECKQRKKNLKSGIVTGKPGAGGLTDCAVCGRRFAPDRLVKHQAICRRNSGGETQKNPKNIEAAVEALAAPINSNWRAKRDEMKRRIGESKQNIKNSVSPPVADVPFALLLSESRKPRNDTSKPQFVPDFELVLETEKRRVVDSFREEENIGLTILDDSLEMEPSIGDLSVSISPELVEEAGSRISQTRREASAWSVEWPGTQKQSKPQPKLLDPRARLEPVKFEFQRPLTRTSSSFTIPTTAASTPVFSEIPISKKYGFEIERGENYRYNHIPAPSIRFN